MNMIMHAPGNLENRNAPPNAHCLWAFSWGAKDFRSILTNIVISTLKFIIEKSRNSEPNSAISSNKSEQLLSFKTFMALDCS